MHNLRARGISVAKTYVSTPHEVDLLQPARKVRWQRLRARFVARKPAYLFASPGLFLILVFIIVPLAYSFYLTFVNYDLAI